MDNLTTHGRETDRDISYLRPQRSIQWQPQGIAVPPPPTAQPRPSPSWRHPSSMPRGRSGQHRRLCSPRSSGGQASLFRKRHLGAAQSFSVFLFQQCESTTWSRQVYEGGLEDGSPSLGDDKCRCLIGIVPHPPHGCNNPSIWRRDDRADDASVDILGPFPDHPLPTRLGDPEGGIGEGDLVQVRHDTTRAGVLQ